MSVAEKPVTESVPRSPSAQLAFSSLLGGLLLLLAFWAIFAGIPLLWTELYLDQVFNEFLSGALVLFATIGAAVGLGYLGSKAEQANPMKGLREGAIFGAIFIYIIARIALGTGHLLERQGMGGIGIGVAVLVGLILLFGLYKWFSLPGFAAWLGRLSDSGWFRGGVFKGTQGVKIRRLTVIAILVLGFWGIITMINQSVLGSEIPGKPNNWEVSVPFTGGKDVATVKVDPATKEATVQEVKVAKTAKVKAADPVVILKTPTGELPVKAGREGYVLDVKVAANAAVSPGQPLVDMEVDTDPYALPVMFKIHIVLPILLGILLIWLAWRVVNLPTFADFLIATEAEMNKVSWTTRRRLVQDTIVVLTTMILMTLFLFVVDILWIKILSSDWVYVLQIDTREAREKMQEKAQW